MNKPLRNLIFVSAATLFSSALWAVPADPRPHTILQPDGTELTICLHGDEFANYTTTDDGFLIAANEQGVYEYATIASDDKGIRTLGVKANPANRRTIAEQQLVEKCRPLAKEKMLQKLAKQQNISAKAVGTRFLPPKILVIMVNYSDVAFSAENTKAAVDSMFNSDAYHYGGAVGSVRQFFSDQSNTAYQPRFTVVGPYTLPNNQAYYGADSGSKQDARVGDLVMDACKLASNDVDFSDYDSNNDKFVDGVYVLYAGRGQADGGGVNTIWPKNWNMASTLILGYAENASQYVSGTTVTYPTYNGVRVNEYVVSQELRSGNVRAGIGTACHEFSHVLGLPDYYDTEYGTNYKNNATPGKWSLMDQGSYNNDGKTPPNYSAHDKFYFGWATPTIMDTPSFVTIPADGATYRAVTTGSLSATSSDEVFYFENRQQTGWDAHLPGHGLLVTKVTYDQDVWDYNEPNNGTPMLYDIQEADGKSTGGDSGDTYPGTKKVTTYTPIDNYDLSDITESADGVITFNFMGGPTCDYRCTEFIREHCTLIDSTECMLSGETYTATLEAELGYELVADEDHFIITMGEDYLEAGTGYTFVDGVLTIPNVTANLTIYASGTKKVIPGQVVLRYNDLEGVVITSGISTNQYIDATQTLTVTLTAAECYETLSEDNLMLEIKVGDTELTDVYAIENGVLTISIAPAQLTDDVSIIVYAEDKPSVTFDGENCTSSNTAACVDSGTAFVTTIVPANGYVVTADNILVTMGSDDADFTFENNVLTVNDVTVALYIVVEATKIIPNQTIAEFIEAEGGECYLTGVVSGIVNTTYGNFDLTDASGSIYVYGLLTAELETKKFASLGVGEKDTLTVLAKTYQVHKGTKEVVDAVYVSHKKYVPSPTEIAATQQGMQVCAVSAAAGLQLVGLPDAAQIRIFDAVGRLLIDEKATANEQTYALRSGLYLIQVSAQGQTTFLKAIR